MRKILMLVVMVVMAVVAMAQTPNKISYQAVVRDGQNRLVTNTNVSVQVQIGTSYSETFSVTTNANGLVSLQIPTDAHQPDFNGINWATTNTITTTITVGSEVLNSTVPVSAVPYALYANSLNPDVLDTLVSENELTVILENYYTKIGVDTLLGAKADTSALNALTNNVYTKAEADELLGAKADTSALNALTNNVYTKAEADELLGAKVDTSTLATTLEDYYTKTGVDTMLAAKADTSDIHDATVTFYKPDNTELTSFTLNTENNQDVYLPGNPLTLKFKRNGNELVAYNAFGGYDFPDVDMSDTSYVIDLKDTITTQAIVKYILAARADTYVNDIDSISRAFRTNVDVKNAIYDTIKAIAMRHEQDALDIALYYFNNISATQMRQILDQLTAASVQNFIDKLNSVLTQADVNNFIDALSHSITPTQVEYLLNALNNKVTPAQVNDFIDALDAAAAHTGTAAWQLKKRLHDYIYSVAHE